jgi:acyl-CoA dehydrogenase
VSTDPLLRLTIDQILSDLCTSAERRRADRDGWSDPLWASLAESGLPWVGVPEDVGGSGGSAQDAGVLLQALGRHAAPVPFAELGFVGGWLLAQGGLPVDQEVLSISTGLTLELRAIRQSRGWMIEGVAPRVPWGRRARHLATLATSPEGLRVIKVPLRDAGLRLGQNLAGEPRDTISLSEMLPEALVSDPVDSIDHRDLLLRAAMSRALLMAGAMQRVAEMTVDYAWLRKQFGRFIATFQAVQHHIVQLSAEAMSAALGVDAGLSRLDLDNADSAFLMATAKILTSESASVVTKLAHQVHGAIGMTEEYELHYFTRRLWSWQQEFGSARYWSRDLGKQVLSAAPDMLWRRITGSAAQVDGSVPGGGARRTSTP